MKKENFHQNNIWIFILNLNFTPHRIWWKLIPICIFLVSTTNLLTSHEKKNVQPEYIIDGGHCLLISISHGGWKTGTIMFLLLLGNSPELLNNYCDDDDDDDGQNSVGSRSTLLSTYLCSRVAKLERMFSFSLMMPSLWS